MLERTVILILVLSVVCFNSAVQNFKREYDKETLEKYRSLFSEPRDEEFGDMSEDDESAHENSWIVRIDPQDSTIADTIAKKYGFENRGTVGSFDGVYKFYHPSSEHHHEEDTSAERKPKSPIRRKRDHIEHASLLRAHPQVRWAKRERILLRDKRTGFDEQNSKIVMNDPMYPQQWYIENTGQTVGPAGFDSRVHEVWKKGYTGKDVVISVLDDGMDHTHPELKDNYDPEASVDLNGRDTDPFPNDSDPYNAHGTKCSGTIAAKANNSLCGTGIAYDAKIGAIRMLDGKATDSLEADAFSFHPQHIDIYSCSWGPKDNGATFGRPGKYGRLALEASATLGRKGKGSIFVWATGNGGMVKDDCDADGYVNSIYTISIGSVNEHGVSTYYGEKCASTMAVTYCSGLHKYGFSDSKANKNGVGRSYNPKFGFGVLNALHLVNKALTWKNVGAQHVCHFRVNMNNRDIPSEGALKLKIKTDGCQSCLQKDKDSNDTCKNAVKKLEHVVVTVTLKYRKRGDLSIELYSPSKTVSNLLQRRTRDKSSNGLKNWSFMTVYNWGENPKGTWILKFIDRKKKRNADSSNRRYHRDMEEVYMEMLDRKKRKMEAKKKSVQQGESDDVESGDVDDHGKRDEGVPDVEIYKRAFDEIRHEHPGFENDEIDEEERYVDDRKRRSSDEFSLDDSPVAGIIQSISVTFYGTA
eukprot:gene7061-7854_t